MFFDPASNRNQAQEVARLKAALGVDRATLDETSHGDLIRALGLACVDHRRMLFDLGEKHRTKLHYGACLSMTELVLTLYLYWMRIDASQPDRPDRDRFILSKGHAAPSLYLALFQAGFVAEDEFEIYRTLDSVFQGHPDRKKLPGIDCTTGSLGQGFPVGCGMAWALQKDQPEARVYCLLSDGECNEGSVWEAALIAANASLGNLVAIIDRNKKSSFGKMAGRNDVEPLAEKWAAFGWRVLSADGHDFVSITAALAGACESVGKPTVIVADTVKGRGIPYAEKNFVRSSSSLPADQLAEARERQSQIEASWLGSPMEAAR